MKSRKGSKSHKVTGQILADSFPHCSDFPTTHFQASACRCITGMIKTASVSCLVLRTVTMFSLYTICKVKSHFSATWWRFCFVFLLLSFIHYTNICWVSLCIKHWTWDVYKWIKQPLLLFGQNKVLALTVLLTFWWKQKIDKMFGGDKYYGKK